MLTGFFFTIISLIVMYIVLSLIGVNNNIQEIANEFILIFEAYFMFAWSFGRYDKMLIGSWKEEFLKKDLGEALGEKSLLIGKDVIIIKNLSTNSYQEFSRISCKIKETEQYLLIFVTDIPALIVPKRCLVEDEIKFLLSELVKK